MVGARAQEEPMLWTRAAAALADGSRVGLAVLADRAGSAPGAVGSLLLLVGSGGRPEGTVGGGPAESTVIDALRARLARPPAPPELVELVHRPGVARPSGLECGGTSTYALWELPADAAASCAALARAAQSGDRLAWRLDQGGWSLAGSTQGGGLTRRDPQWRFSHLAGPSPRVVIAGGGHVGLALSRVLVPLGFAVTVVEERPDVATFVANSCAHRLLACRFEDLPNEVDTTAEDLAVIATHSAASDRRALAALAASPLAYLGILGSRAKCARLVSEQFGPAGPPACVHAPAGLPIGSQTPAEIAVSIAAELVAVRSGAAGRMVQ